jgi:transcriptional regulator with XRE-family HTH domain
MTTVQTEWVVPDWSFGDRIRKVRTLTGMTQAEFAEAISVGEASLAQWETDRARPRDILDVAHRVERLFQIPAAWLLGVDANFPTQATFDAKRGTNGGGGGRNPRHRLPLPWLDSSQQPFGSHSTMFSKTSAPRSAHLLGCPKYLDDR